jgi:hypothetical protein
MGSVLAVLIQAGRASSLCLCIILNMKNIQLVNIKISVVCNTYVKVC